MVVREESKDGVVVPESAAVEARELTRRYGEGETAVDALRGVDLEVRSGELVAVMGPSGSGKSTLMHILAGLDKPTSGTVQIAGTEITRLEDSQLTMLRRKHIGFVFQFFNLLPMLDAEENVVLPLSIAGEKPDKAWLDELLGKMGLADRRRHRPSELSGGQQQRVAIARALVQQPVLMLADEPIASLDPDLSHHILSLLCQLAGEARVALLCSLHQHDLAERYFDRIVRMQDGMISERGSPASRFAAVS
jgi:putative ABC transport system ATP-binding protein